VTSESWTALSVAEVETVPWRDTDVVWRPLRAALGLHAFGASAFSAQQPGQLVVEPHREENDGRGHEELYIVLEGHASFRLDADVLSAPAGTLVRVAPSVHREATALVAPTTVLAFGAPATFKVAGSEWTERARPFMQTDPIRARRILDEGLRELRESPGLTYGIALLAAAEGRHDDARDALTRAIAAEPLLRREAAQDPSLAPLLPVP
jgi:hypothetical protein